MSAHPPLNALRAFEAVARTGSFTAAGVDLGVTSAAVSQQVRNLESFWNKKLFIRQGNRLDLSDAGLAAYPATAQAMNTVTDLSNMMSDTRQRSSLVISAPLSVAQTWLPTKLAAGDLVEDFDGSKSNRLTIRVEDDPVEFTGDGAHLRVFYGHGLYSEFHVETLFRDFLIAVASPEFVARHGSSTDQIDERQLIHTFWGPDYASSPNWSTVMPAPRSIDIAAGLIVSASSVAIAFARTGRGVALVPSAMVAGDIAAGLLEKMDSKEAEMPHPYRLAFSRSLQHRKDLQRVVRSLKI